MRIRIERDGEYMRVVVNDAHGTWFVAVPRGNVIDVHPRNLPSEREQKLVKRVRDDLAAGFPLKDLLFKAEQSHGRGYGDRAYYLLTGEERV